MSDLNSVLFIGRVTRDGELKYLESGAAILKFSLAVNRSIPPKDGGEWKNEASFFDLQAWGKMAEQKAPHIVKGKQIAVVGKLRQDRWEKDGQSQSKIYVVVSGIQILADPRPKGEQDQPPKKEEPARKSPYNPDGSVRPSPDEFTDDIPF